MTDESSSHQDVAALQAEIESLRAQLNSRDNAHEQVLWQLSRDLLAVADEQGSLANVNPAWTRNLGWSLDEIIGQNLGEFVHEEDREETLDALQKLDRDGSTAEFKSRMRTASGSYRLLDGRVDRMRGRIFIVARDITELREREIALNDSRDFARLALSAVSGVGAWTYEVASDCFFCDAAVSELYGIDAKEAARGIRREGFRECPSGRPRRVAVHDVGRPRAQRRSRTRVPHSSSRRFYPLGLVARQYAFQRRRRAGAAHGRRHRHDFAAGPRTAAAPESENGSGRASDRRHRARLQQHAARRDRTARTHPASRHEGQYRWPRSLHRDSDLFGQSAAGLTHRLLRFRAGSRSRRSRWIFASSSYRSKT